jgi:tetratricopeptide (TPR) repeat protein
MHVYQDTCTTAMCTDNQVVPVIQDSVKEHDSSMHQFLSAEQMSGSQPAIRKHVKLNADTKPAVKQALFSKEDHSTGKDGRRLPSDWDALAKAMEDSESEPPNVSGTEGDARTQTGLVNSSGMDYPPVGPFQSTMPLCQPGFMALKVHHGQIGIFVEPELPFQMLTSGHHADYVSSLKALQNNVFMALNEAVKLKDKGNECYKAGELQRALDFYSGAKCCFGTGMESSPEGVELQTTVFANLAAVHIKQKAWQDAVVACTSALELNKHHPKALMRRANAYIELLRYREALADADTLLGQVRTNQAHY